VRGDGIQVQLEEHRGAYTDRGADRFIGARIIAHALAASEKNRAEDARVPVSPPFPTDADCVAVELAVARFVPVS
jgi:hypothetical protein|tara:strand:- start:1606 stop:1830 length:225 start_codon:yes stop_codon:yes gene_type:complete